MDVSLVSIEKLPSGKYRAVVRHGGAKRASEAVSTVAEAKMLEAKVASVACSARSTATSENTQRPAPGMIGRTGEDPLRTARLSDSGWMPQRWASSSVVSVSRAPRFVMSMSL
jgi:hypothetical protein